MDSKVFLCPRQGDEVLFGSLVAVAMTIVIVTIISYKKREDIKLLLFAKLAIRPFYSQAEIHTSRYDAYTMYSDLDYEWARNVLAEGLRRKGFRVYDKNEHSDFGTIADQIEEAMNLSHRIIVVLSKNFLNDQEMINEFYRADTHDKDRGTSRYIIPALLEQPDHLLSHQELKEHNYDIWEISTYRVLCLC